MKRVSLKVAKAIKEAGYPQEKKDGTALYPVKGEFKGKLCGYNSTAPERDKLSIVAPTYFEVWKWLWKEKGLRLSVEYTRQTETEYVSWCTLNQEHLRCTAVSNDDPEEAIITAIEYLVDNDLIK